MSDKSAGSGPRALTFEEAVAHVRATGHEAWAYAGRGRDAGDIALIVRHAPGEHAKRNGGSGISIIISGGPLSEVGDEPEEECAINEAPASFRGLTYYRVVEGCDALSLPTGAAHAELERRSREYRVPPDIRG